jgi:hypothetical protein
VAGKIEEAPVDGGVAEAPANAFADRMSRGPEACHVDDGKGGLGGTSRAEHLRHGNL